MLSPCCDDNPKWTLPDPRSLTYVVIWPMKGTVRDMQDNDGPHRDEWQRRMILLAAEREARPALASSPPTERETCRNREEEDPERWDGMG